MEEIISRLKTQIDALLSTGKQIVVAIDGNCTAGKTTLATILEKEYDCNVFHMDDFFLQNHQRTEQRLAEAGGNVDYERFFQEVLLPLQRGEAVSFHPFDCQTRQLKAAVTMPRKRLNIIEGTYSCHPHFGKVYDLTVFLTVSPETQRKRIMERPAFLHRSFFDLWIPMEHTYFDTFSVAQGCDILCGSQEEP